MESAPTAAGVGVLDEPECWRLLLQGSCNRYIENAAVTGRLPVTAALLCYLFKASLVTFFSKKVNQPGCLPM
mgnify:FL=1